MVKVIIIDDEYIVRQGLVETINWEDYGLEIVGTAENGEQGLALARKTMPDIIITDLYMPKMDGLDFVAAIRANDILAKVIVLSGFADISFDKEIMGNDIGAYLLKPVDTDELILSIKDIMKQIQSV